MSSEESERVVVSTFVSLPPRDAFEIFTAQIDAWWKQTPRYRSMPGQTGKLGFEGSPPDRLVERARARAGEATASTVLARVLAWEVGKRLAFAWRAGDFSDATDSEVEIRFEALREGTRVTLEHRGLDRLPPQHPARRGLSGEAFAAMISYFWADLLTSLRLHRD
jgi:hypothetical protein